MKMDIIRSYIICTGRTHHFKKKTFHLFFFYILQGPKSSQGSGRGKEEKKMAFKI